MIPNDAQMCQVGSEVPSARDSVDAGADAGYDPGTSTVWDHHRRHLSVLARRSLQRGRGLMHPLRPLLDQQVNYTQS